MIGHMPTTYISQATEALREALRHQGKDPDKSLTPALQQLYVLLLLTRGDLTTLADVHDAWAVARAVERPDHPDLVPFVLLAPEVAEYDRPFVTAIHAAARFLAGGEW
jgi:hypothetical protein